MFTKKNLDSFLVLADELQLKGLTQNQEAETFREQAVVQGIEQDSPKYSSMSKWNPLNKDDCLEKTFVQTADDKMLATTDHTTNNTDIKNLNQQLKLMLIISENTDPHSKIGEKTRICKVCGKEGSFSNMKSHVEAKHIFGISVPCGLCGKSFKTRNSLTTHQHLFHKSQRKNRSTRDGL